MTDTTNDAPEAGAIPDDLNAEFEQIEAEAEAAEGGEAPHSGTVEPPQFSTKEQIAMALGPAFQVLAPAWGVTPQEIDVLAESYANVIDKYWPDGLPIGVELTAIMTTAMIIVPRAHMPRRLKPVQQAKEGTQADDA